MGRITAIRGREIFDSRGNPTVEAEVFTDNGTFGRAAVPSGKSTGKYEALELRDGDKARLDGKSVLQAIAHIHEIIAPAIIGREVTEQQQIDQTMLELDGTPNKAKLGANAILAVSLACARAGAAATGAPLFQYLGGTGASLLPVPLLNVINGGAHADNALDIQEFMIVPCGFESFREAYNAGTVVYRALKKVISAHGFATNVGDEGGFAPGLGSDRGALEMLVEAVERTQYRLGEQIYFALDCAASEYFKDGRYVLRGEDLSLDGEGMGQWYGELVEQFPIISIEDPFAEDDWSSTKLFTEHFGDRVQVVGDDLLVTNVERLKQAIDDRTCNSILVKLNQIGTLTEATGAIKLAQASGFTTIISHRSGETEDTFISHLAVAYGAGQIKSGAPARTDRVAKYNELLRIEEMLGGSARYAAKSMLKAARA